MPPQFIYTMYGLKKIVPGTQREILKGAVASRVELVAGMTSPA